MPWDIRTETQSAKKRRMERLAQREREAKRRLDREKYNSIDQYLLSGDEQVHSKRAIHRITHFNSYLQRILPYF